MKILKLLIINIILSFSCKSQIHPVQYVKADLFNERNKINYDSLKYAQKQWEFYDSNNSAFKGEVESIGIDKKGIAWINSEGKVYKLNDKSWIIYEPKYIEANSNKLWSAHIYYSPISNFIWFSYWHIDTETWNFINNEGKVFKFKKDGRCNSICQDLDGNVFGIFDEFYIYYNSKKNKLLIYNPDDYDEDNIPSSYKKFEYLENYSYCDLTVDSNGYITTLYENSIARFIKGKWITTPLPAEFKPNKYQESHIAFNSKGDCWISVDETYNPTLIKISDGKYQIFTKKDLLDRIHLLQKIYVDDNGDAWFAFLNNGVAKFDGKIWTHFMPNNSLLKDRNVKTIQIDNKNRIWIVTDSGLYLFKNGSVD